jgi:hypothetical protein
MKKHFTIHEGDVGSEAYSEEYVKELEELVKLAWYVRSENAENFISPEWRKERTLGDIFNPLVADIDLKPHE